MLGIEERIVVQSFSSQKRADSDPAKEISV